ncbi:hypothetical protein P280DRAFT_374743, partial [Massarina eburnea CBS 473.64]
YTGIDGMDTFLQTLVTCFLPGVVGMDKGFQVLQMYFLVEFFPIITIFCVESGRAGNRWSLIGFPAIYGFLYQSIGGAIVIPFYFVAYIYTSRQRDYYSASSMSIAAAHVKAIIPALVIGYLLPTILLYSPVWDAPTHQRIVAFWQPCPLYVSLILTILPTVFSFSSSSNFSQNEQLNPLRSIYAFSFLVASVWHVGTMAYCLTSQNPRASLGAVFDPRFSASGSIFIDGLQYIFQIDFWVIFATALLWAFTIVYDLRRLGRASVSPLNVLVYFALGSVVVGPAAVLAGTWYWREG